MSKKIRRNRGGIPKWEEEEGRRGEERDRTRSKTTTGYRKRHG